MWYNIKMIQHALIQCYIVLSHKNDIMQYIISDELNSIRAITLVANSKHLRRFWMF